MSSPRSSPVGDYLAYINGQTNADTLAIDGDSTMTIAGDTGYWVIRGKYVAFVINDDANLCVFLGAADKQGFDSAAQPGPWRCASGTSGKWHAVRNPPR
jgi:hypothetical protein